MAEYKKKTAKHSVGKMPSKPKKPAKKSADKAKSKKPAKEVTETIVMKENRGSAKRVTGSADTSAKRANVNGSKSGNSVSNPKKRNARTQKNSGGTDPKGNKQNPLSELKVILGKKNILKRKQTVTFSIVCLLLIGIILFAVLTPTGPFEYINNGIKTFGEGSFPASFSGSELKNAYSVGSLTYILTDTHAEIYNKQGKCLFSRLHNFNAPAMDVSSQRAIVYDRGGNTLYVFNHSDVIKTINTEYDILTADIGRNGTIAVATKSKGYAAQVEVYSKSGKSKYIWYSSGEIVNAVSVADSGRRIAVATVSTSGGEYSSKLHVLRFNSADPVYTLEYNSSIIYSVESLSYSRFSVVTDGGIDFMRWRSSDNKTTYVNKYDMNVFRTTFGRYNVAVTGVKSQDTVAVFNNKGKTISEFAFDGAVADVNVYGKNVYVLSDGYLYILDFNGTKVAEKINVANYSRVFPVSNKYVVAAGNFGLDRYLIEKK